MKNQNTHRIGLAFMRGLGLILMLAVSSARADFTLSSTGQSFAGDRLQDALDAAAVEDTITVHGVNTGMATVGPNWNDAKPRVRVKDKKITFVGTGSPTKMDASSYSSVINNYWIEISGSDENRASYTFRNLKFTGDSAVIGIEIEGTSSVSDNIRIGTLAFERCHVNVKTSVGNGKSGGNGYYHALGNNGTVDRYWYNAFLCINTANDHGVTKYFKLQDSFFSTEDNGTNSDRTVSGAWDVVKADILGCVFGKPTEACRDNLAIVFDAIGNGRNNAIDSTTPIEITIKGNTYYMRGEYQVMFYIQYKNVEDHCHHVNIVMEDNVVDASGWPTMGQKAYGGNGFLQDTWMRLANISSAGNVTKWSKYWMLRSRRNTVNGHCAHIFGNAKNLVKEGYNNVLDEQHGHWWEHVKDVPSYGTKTNANLYRETIGGVPQNCAQEGTAAYGAGIHHFDENKYCELCDTVVVTKPVLTSLWITDHADAGAGKVHLAFQPVFDRPVDMGVWISEARENGLIHYVAADTEAELANAPLKDDFTFRNEDGMKDAQKGWCWITVPSTHKLYKVVICKNEQQDGVQLWEGGPYWASCNVGATKPEEYGYYFWWGDTVGYTNDGSKWISVKDGEPITFTTGTTGQTWNKDLATLTSEGWIGADGNLVTTHDAATANRGAPWRMPTSSELKLLGEKCDHELTTLEGVKGCRFTGRGTYASYSIFLPAAGFALDDSCTSSEDNGDYMSSTPDANNIQYSDIFFFKVSNSDYFGLYSTFRYYGRASCASCTRFSEMSFSITAMSPHQHRLAGMVFVCVRSGMPTNSVTRDPPEGRALRV